jgi:hypothetical protein
MALTINTQDLENYPGTVKKITVDLSSIVPIGAEGDEKFVLSTATSNYSDNVARTTIQSLYVTDIVAGWCKSSGFAGSAGKFYLNSTNKSLKVKMDATVSGVDGTGFYTVDLTPNDDNTPVSGEIIAAELETKIRAISNTINSADIGFSNAYRSASVEYRNGKFWVVSGSISTHYSGNSRSSVVIMAADTNDCSKVLGFDLPTTSLALDSIAVKETLLTSTYTADDPTLSVNTGMGATAGMTFMITDGTPENTEYFTALSGTTDSTINVPTLGVNGYTGITKSYTANEAKLQLMRAQDPENIPTNWYTSVDQLIRYGIKVIANQIDYSS